MDKRIVFMGSPEFAVPTLRALTGAFNVVGVVTQPDRPAGRGRALKPPPVKALAGELDIPVIQPNRLKDAEAMNQLEDWKPDAIVVAAFGQILKSEVLELPTFGCINVHASLLPRWRGAAPIQAAILHGDEETGVTIMKMDAGVDTGPVFSQRAITIRPEDTAGTLSTRLAQLGAELLAETLPAILNGNLTPTPQDDKDASYAPMLKKVEGELDLRETAEELVRRVRAFQPWPGTYFTWDEKVIKVHRAHAVEAATQRPGEHTTHAGLPALTTAEGLLVLDDVQPAGKKPMPGETFLHGARNWQTSS